MQKYILVIWLLSASYLCLEAQPGELSSPFSHTYLLDNPAAMGLDGKHHLFLGAYQKWFQLEDAPQSYFLSSAHPFFNRALGIGGTLVFDQAGLINTTRLGLNFGVHFNPDSPHRFSLGASARFQAISFDLPNTEDLLLASEPGASHINLGLGLNYQAGLGDGDDSFFNLYIAMPQFPATLDLTKKDASGVPGTYSLPSDLLIQANLQYELSGGNYFTPSLRYQTQLSGSLSKSQILDLGLGVSFLEDAFNVRAGIRTGQASQIYAGLGIRLGQIAKAHILVEPGGPLGTSAAFDAELTWGEPQPKAEQDGGRISKMTCWKDTECLQERLAAQGLGTSFKAQSVTNDNSVFTFITYSFSEGIGSVKYLEDTDFLERYPLPKLFEEIQKMLQEAKISTDEEKVVQVTYRIKVNATLNDATFESNSGSPFKMEYWESGALLQSKNIETGHVFTEAELAGAKIHFLAEALKKQTPLLQNTNSRFEVIYDPNMVSYREVEIVLYVK